MASKPPPTDADTASTLHIPRAPLPGDDDDDDAFVVMHDEFRSIMNDVRSSRDGVALLVRLLQDTDEVALLVQGTAPGLAALLDGVRTRLDLACDGLDGTAYQLGMKVLQ